MYGVLLVEDNTRSKVHGARWLFSTATSSLGFQIDVKHTITYKFGWCVHQASYTLLLYYCCCCNKWKLGNITMACQGAFSTQHSILCARYMGAYQAISGFLLVDFVGVQNREPCLKLQCVHLLWIIGVKYLYSQEYSLEISIHKKLCFNLIVESM